MVLIMYKYQLSDVEWGEFSLSSIFNIKDGYYNKKPPIEGGTIPFLSATQYNNGISTFYKKEILLTYDKVGEKTNKDADKRIFDGNCLTITNNGSVGNVYYQKEKFTCSHDVTPIYLKGYKLNSNLAKFLIPMLEQSGKSFEYAKKWRPKRMRKSKILLPIDLKGNPNWHFMEEYIREREIKQKNDLKEYYKSRLLDLVICPEVLTDVEWGEFSLRDLFVFERGNQNNMSACEFGEIPLISAKKIDNGVKAFISDNGKKLFQGHILTLNNDGDGGVGIAYYQANKMALDTHVTALIPLIPINRSSLLFISKTITIQRDKFSHGYSLNNNRMKAQKIVLPIDENGNPNWTYMENFIKNIEQKQIKNVLKYLDEYIYIYI